MLLVCVFVYPVLAGTYAVPNSLQWYAQEQQK